MIASKPWLKLLGVVIALFALAFIVAACDDDDDDDGNGDSTDPIPTQPADGDGDDGDGDGDGNDGDDGAGGSVDISLEEFSVNPSASSVSSGEVTFNITNNGAIDHNFRVIKTDLAADALPIDGVEVDETQVDVLGSSSDLGAGAAEEVTATLEAGSYALICNVPTHYEAGMSVAFTVE